MSDKQPDKATPLDEDMGVPTYNAKPASKDSVSSEKNSKPGLFERAGRAEPQEIKPSQARQDRPETEVMSYSSANEAARQQSGASEETVAFAQPESATPVSAEEESALATADAPEEGAASAETAEEREARLEAEKEEKGGDHRYGRRGTIDFGLLFIRIALSAYLIIAGAKTFFELGDSQGLSGLEGDFANYAWDTALSIAVPTMQLIAGVFLLLGLITPLAAMLGLVVTGFSAVHELAQTDAGLDVFSWPDSVWLSLVLFVIAVGLQFTGPGFISLDFKRSWARRPLGTSWVFVLIGVAILVALWFFGAGVNPLK
mgnify:CR=1 FL=1